MLKAESQTSTTITITKAYHATQLRTIKQCNNIIAIRNDKINYLFNMLCLDIALSSLKSHFQGIHTVMPSCAQSVLIIIIIIIMAIKIK